MSVFDSLLGSGLLGEGGPGSCANAAANAQSMAALQNSASPFSPGSMAYLLNAASAQTGITSFAFPPARPRFRPRNICFAGSVYDSRTRKPE